MHGRVDQDPELRSLAVEQRRHLARRDALEGRLARAVRIRVALPIEPGCRPISREVAFIETPRGWQSDALFAVAYGQGETIYRRGARGGDPTMLARLLADPNRAAQVFEPFRGLPPRLLGWATGEDRGPGFHVNADPLFRDPDPLTDLERERSEIDAALSLASWRWAARLRERWAHEGSGDPDRAAWAISALLLDPGLGARLAARWFDAAAADPYWTFEAGGCVLLALALALDTGGERVVLRVRDPKFGDGAIEHAAVRLGTRYLDVRGLREERILRQEWAAALEVDPKLIAIVPAEWDELLAHARVTSPEFSALAAWIALALPGPLACLRALADPLELAP